MMRAGLFFLLLLLPLQIFATGYSKRDSIRDILTVAHDSLYSNPAFSLEIYLRNNEVTKSFGDDSLHSRSLRGTGNAYFIVGQFELALNYYLQSLSVAERMNDPGQIAANLGNIGGVYYMTAQLEKSLDYYKRSLKHAVDNNITHHKASAYNNLGLVYQSMKRPQEALIYFIKALEIETVLEDTLSISGLYLNMANTNRDLGNPEKALDYYHRAISMRKGNEYSYGLADCYASLADFHLDTHPDSAAYYGKMSADIAEGLGSYFILERAYNVLYETSLNQRDYFAALDYYIKHDAAGDTIASQEVLEQETRYKLEKKSREIELEQVRREEVQKAEILQARTIRNFSLGGFAAISVLMGLVLFSYRRNRKLNTLLTQRNEEINEKNREITDSIRYARRLQQAILPSLKACNEICPRAMVYYKPKDIVAGDFYWFEKTPKYTWIAAADCTGHGVPGAMLSVVCSNALNRAIFEFGIEETGAVLDKVTELVVDTLKSSGEVKDGMDISLIRIEPSTGKACWSGANNPLWIYSNGTWEIIKPDKQPVGRFEGRKPFSTHRIELKKGDDIWLFTDGYTDQFGGKDGKKLKAGLFRELLSEVNQFPVEERNSKLDEFFNRWKGNLDQVDDICVIGIRYQ